MRSRPDDNYAYSRAGPDEEGPPPPDNRLCADGNSLELWSPANMRWNKYSIYEGPIGARGKSRQLCPPAPGAEYQLKASATVSLRGGPLALMIMKSFPGGNHNFLAAPVG